MTDTYYLQNQIQLELNNLNRGHVYYSVDEQPEMCARLIARGIRGHKSSEDILEQIKENVEEVAKRVVDSLGYDPRENIGKLFNDCLMGTAKEEIYSHRVSVTVQSSEDIGPAIRLIMERQRKFKKRNNL